MKIYTKTGDKGSTSLLSGKRVPKYNERINAYGTIDELNSHIGLLRSYDIPEENKTFLIGIQNLLFTIGSNLADDSENNKFNLPKITNDHIEKIEKEIDVLDEELPSLSSFILPGGDLAVAQSHICRTVCRRAEREIVTLSESVQVDILIIQFLNRLSDYLFTLSRSLSHHFNIEQTPWVHE